ncbi:hypothetical protein RhiirC2_800103 [Rhizophagus irregularis]|uniref:Uncharacterized protein n=1 Tax=Rhizophagus irregularis TaxID=588596 RepID=A0A2N1M425_9GLOM|nr:hypothetical protein RhiirC2_800103 [Rhizophagus irregularis]
MSFWIKQYSNSNIKDYMNNITLKSVTNGNNQSHETLKTIPSGNNQTNVSEVQANTLILAEINIPTVSIPLTHDSNSSTHSFLFRRSC